MLLPAVMRESLAFAASARGLVFDLSLQLARDRLRGLAKLPLWCGKDQPVYSLTPSEHMTAVRYFPKRRARMHFFMFLFFLFFFFFFLLLSTDWTDLI